jgi:hypothetical protein
MKRFFYFSVIIITAAIFSCKKETTPDSTNTLSSKDPVALSKSIKVWHGLRVQGKAPLPVGGANAPEIETPDAPIIHSFAGKFAIVKPTVVSGNIAGYYVGVNGAADYFKIDYTKPRITERRKPSTHHGFGFRPDSTGGNSDYMDSSIVITLPANFQTPDTFCITYCAYDEFGNISQPVTSCIVVSKLGGDASTGFLEGTWRMFAQPNFDSSLNQEYDTIQYGKWKKDIYYTEYYCNTKFDGTSEISSYCYDTYAPCNQLNITDSINEKENDFVLTNNGSMTYTYSSNFKRINLSTSICSSVNYDISPSHDFTKGGWSITGDKMIFVFEYDNYGTSDLDAVEFTFQKISDAEFKLAYSYSQGDEYKYILKKL